MSLFLLSQVFLIVSHSPLVQILTSIILFGNADILSLTAPEEWLNQFRLNCQQNENNVEAEASAVDKPIPSNESCPEPKPNQNLLTQPNLNITDEEKEKLLALGELEK